MNTVQPVILSGGSGTRLWPLSREAYPKQFLPLAGELTMLQATWQRVAPIASRGPLVIANEEHRFVAAEQLQQVGAEPAAIILEPDRWKFNYQSKWNLPDDFDRAFSSEID